MCFYKSSPVVLTVDTASTEAPVKVHVCSHTHLRFLLHRKDTRAVVRVHLGAEKVFSRKHLCSFGLIGFYTGQMETALNKKRGTKFLF